MCRKSKLQTCLYALILFVFSVSVNAQCAMCRAALGGDGNKIQAQAVNDGIVYLMLIPYILVAGVGFAVYRLYKKKKSE
jgi:hypothetical protein